MQSALVTASRMAFGALHAPSPTGTMNLHAEDVDGQARADRTVGLSGAHSSHASVYLVCCSHAFFRGKNLDEPIGCLPFISFPPGRILSGACSRCAHTPIYLLHFAPVCIHTSDTMAAALCAQTFLGASLRSVVPTKGQVMPCSAPMLVASPLWC